MSLTARMSEYVSACFTGIWIESYEHDDAIAEIAELCRIENWRLATWDVSQGLRLYGAEATVDTGPNDPLAAVRALASFPPSDQPTLLVLVNFHRFVQSAEVMQTLARQIQLGKQNRTFVVILSPVVQIPAELEKQFIILEHELPTRNQLEQIVRGIATDAREMPDESDMERVLDAAAGMTRFEAEGAFSLGLIRHGQVSPETIWELKCQTLKKSGLLSLHRGGERFDDLGGLDSLKAFCLRAMRRQRVHERRCRPRGVLLLGVPGTGKSAFCKALGNETGRPTLILDVGSLMGSLVGQSEAQTRQALRIVDAMAPCVLMLDEVEKALSGVAGSGQSDSGVSARMFGSLLTWLNDHTSDVFVVCTANDVSKLPPEFTRAERFDGVFFLDLPNDQQKQLIWRQYQQLFELDSQQKLPDDANWTGAEIRACCRLAALLDVPLVQAAQNVVPVAVTAAESVERLRTWATGRCLNADRVGLFQHDVNSTATTRRKISPRPSQN